MVSRKVMSTLLLLLSINNIVYSYVLSIGTECLQKKVMFVALIAIFFTTFMIFVERGGN